MQSCDDNEDVHSNEIPLDCVKISSINESLKKLKNLKTRLSSESITITSEEMPSKSNDNK